jgi:hypothetical protein
MRWTKDAFTAAWDGTTLHLVAPGTGQRFSTPELKQYATTEALAVELGPELTVEILATIKHGPLDRTPDPTGRRSVPRVFGFGKRGESTPGAWLFGRSVRLSAVRGPDLPFEKILTEGLPPGHGLDRAGAGRDGGPQAAARLDPTAVEHVGCDIQPLAARVGIGRGAEIKLRAPAVLFLDRHGHAGHEHRVRHISAGPHAICGISSRSGTTVTPPFTFNKNPTGGCLRVSP